MILEMGGRDLRREGGRKKRKRKGKREKGKNGDGALFSLMYGTSTTFESCNGGEE